MTLVSISEAARLTKRSRTTIYRYRDEGKINISSDHQGNPMIDTSELMRVFGEISLDRPEHSLEQRDEHRVTDEIDTVHPSKTTENIMLRESIPHPASQAPHAPWWKF